MKVRRALVLGALVSVLVLGCLVSLQAFSASGKKHKPNVVVGGVTGKVKPDVAAVSNLAMAHSVIEYGRKNKSPEALITAAEILGTIPTKQLKARPTSKSHAIASGTAPKDDPMALLAEAKEMSNNDPGIVALADKAAQSITASLNLRGSVQGISLNYTYVMPYSTDVYSIAFNGEEYARAAIAGNGNTQLTLSVYDLNGNYIGSDECYTEPCVVTWVPRWTGPFILKVHNLGAVSNRYLIGVN